MDESIKQLGQDLALAKYAKTTRRKYLKTAEHLGSRFGRPLTEVTREQLRAYVEEISSLGKSASWLTCQICALSFLYRKTLGQSERVSFLSYPRRARPLPRVLSLEEVSALIGAIRVARYQAIVMVLYGAGLRITEALALEVSDIDGARGVIRVRYGKGNKAREAKLSPTLYAWLRQSGRGSDRRCPIYSRRARRANGPAPSRYGRRSRTQPSRRGSKSASPPTCCVTVLQHTCSSREPTSAWSAPCSVMRACSRPRATGA